jgi:hypothetical protein
VAVAQLFSLGFDTTQKYDIKTVSKRSYQGIGAFSLGAQYFAAS